MSTMRLLTTRPPLAFAVLVATLAVIAGALQLRSTGDAIDQPPKISRMELISVADFSDDRRLAGFAQDLFVGRVAGEGRTDDTEPVIQTDFPVEVLDSIKGPARGSVVVAQQGGYLPASNELRLMENDQLLEPGRTYLFATRTDAEGRHLLVPEFGDLLVRNAAHRDELRQRFTEANRSAIPFSAQG
jgi:hypothetical protein